MSDKKVNIISGVGLSILSITAFMLSIAGCDKVNKVEVEASVESGFKIGHNSKIDGAYATEIIDKGTGVYYLVLRNNGDVAITPLYNVDGSLKVEGGNTNE